jgi:hypothetical protein
VDMWSPSTKLQYMFEAICILLLFNRNPLIQLNPKYNIELSELIKLPRQINMLYEGRLKFTHGKCEINNLSH